MADLAHDVVSDYRTAAKGFGSRLSLVEPRHWGQPTPCADWDVRQLVAHVLDEQLWVAPLLMGQTIAEVGDRFAGDQMGDDAVAAWSAASSDAVAALSDDTALEGTVHLSYGDEGGREYAWQVTVDTFIHTWDLARALEADESLDPTVLDHALEYLGPRAEMWRSAGAFGQAVETADDASPQARLLALVGRSV